MSSHLRPRLRALLFGAGIAALGSAANATDLTEQPTPDDGGAVSTLEIVGTRSIAERKQAPSTVETVDAAVIAATVNAVNVEDQLKYLPSILIRKRHIGDLQAPMATRTSGVGASARSVIYVDGVLISALIGNNNTNASPRWGMAPAEAIDRIEVLYGPFSAAYPGNSVGAAVEITTRMPQTFGGGVQVSGSRQAFEEYATKDSYGAGQLSADIGDRRGRFAWRLNLQRTVSDSQPLALATATRPAAPGAAGAPVTGAIADVNRTGAPVFVLGAGGFEHQEQDNETLKASFDVTANLTLAYTLGRFGNQTEATAQSYLRDAGGGAVFAGAVNAGGYALNVPAGTFSNNVYHFDETHWMQALTAAYVGDEHLDARLVLSAYDYGRDEQRTPSTALPGAQTGGAGSIARLDGTGWKTADLIVSLRDMGSGEAHDISYGLHADRFVLRNIRYNTADWLAGAPGAVALQGRGKTATTAAFVQDVWQATPSVAVTVGARYERWRAYDGFNFSLAPALAVTQPGLSAERLSPKLALTWRPDESWRFSAAYGEAFRFPTVTELYQAIATGPTLTVPNPNLRPEHARSFELAAERRNEHGRVRVSYFEEHLEDALISQSAPLPPNPATQLFNFVQNVDKVRARGVEAVVERRDVLVRGLDLTASLTLVDPKIVADAAFPAAVGKRTPQVARRRATIVATYRPDAKWSFTAAARYSDKVFGTIDNSDSVGHTFQGFEDYLVVDARATYRLDEHWTAALGVDNANDRSYFLFHPFPQRSVIAELSYRF